MESTVEQKLKELQEKKQRWKEGGGTEKNQKQHERGKMTARERLEHLFDPGTFIEYGLFAQPDSSLHGLDKEFAPGDGVIIGFGKVNGRMVWGVSQDATILGGSMGNNHCRKICRAGEEAARNGYPCVYFWDGGGGRIQEAWFANIYRCMMVAAANSGYIPTVSVICGACAGGSAYAPILNDFVICVDQTSRFYLCGPSVIRQATGEEVNGEELAGAYTENSISGNAHQWAANDEEAIAHVKAYLSYMPSNCKEKPPIIPYMDDRDRLIPELDHILPDNPCKGYDVMEIIRLIADTDSLYEYQPYWAQNLVTCFGRIMGETVGFIANQAKVKAGSFDIDSSDKFARFVDILDCYQIPVITLTDTPGFLPGRDQEHGGIIRHGAKTLEAIFRATVPKIQVVLRKQIGGGALPMGMNLFNLDMNLYWPTLNYGIMDPRSACEIITAKQRKQDPEHGEEILKEAIRTFTEARTPYAMAGHLWADDIIEPNQTRMYLIRALEMLRGKNQKPASFTECEKKHSVSPR